MDHLTVSTPTVVAVKQRNQINGTLLQSVLNYYIVPFVGQTDTDVTTSFLTLTLQVESFYEVQVPLKTRVEQLFLENRLCVCAGQTHSSL
jgi:hypothetical protein